MVPPDDELFPVPDEDGRLDGAEDERASGNVQDESGIERSGRLSDPRAEAARLAAQEIRGHLAILSGYLSMLEDGTLGRLPAAARSALPPMRAKAGAISRVVEDILEKARIQDGGVRRSSTPDDLGVVPSAIDAAAHPTDPTDR